MKPCKVCGKETLCLEHLLSSDQIDDYEPNPEYPVSPDQQEES